MTFYFITHPNVVISRDVPVPRWPLSELGRGRMRAGLRQPWMREISAVYCSTEQKAIEGAAIIAEHLSLPLTQVEELGENDRSATGFLSVRGWERAVDAQARVVAAVQRIAINEESEGAVAVVAHGAVGTLLYCHLAGEPIARRWDQPANGGGNYYRFTLSPRAVQSWWKPIDA